MHVPHTIQMRRWKSWELETKTAEYQFSHGTLLVCLYMLLLCVVVLYCIALHLNSTDECVATLSKIFKQILTGLDLQGIHHLAVGT